MGRAREWFMVTHLEVRRLSVLLARRRAAECTRARGRGADGRCSVGAAQTVPGLSTMSVGRAPSHPPQGHGAPSGTEGGAPRHVNARSKMQ